MNASTNYAPDNNPEVIEVESSQLYPLESFTKQIALSYKREETLTPEIGNVPLIVRMDDPT